MPLFIKTNSSKNPTNILIAFEKNKEDKALVQSLAGLSYEPTLSLNAKDTVTFIHHQQEQKIIVLGLGEEKDATRSYHYFRSIVHQLRSKSPLVIEVLASHLTEDHLTNAVIGLRHGLLNVGSFKTNGNKITEPEITLVIDKNQKHITSKALSIAESQLGAMHLVDMPSNIKTPKYMADFAIASGKQHGFDVKVFDKKQLTKLKCDALLAVGQGSVNEPVMIVMEYKPKKANQKLLN